MADIVAIKYSIPVETNVNISIYNAQGKKIADVKTALENREHIRLYTRQGNYRPAFTFLL